jgi:hypothetical protein
VRRAKAAGEGGGGSGGGSAGGKPTGKGANQARHRGPELDIQQPSFFGGDSVEGGDDEPEEPEAVGRRATSSRQRQKRRPLDGGDTQPSSVHVLKGRRPSACRCIPVTHPRRPPVDASGCLVLSRLLVHATRRKPQPAFIYAAQQQLLLDMGFSDEAKIQAALVSCNGDAQQAVNFLV